MNDVSTARQARLDLGRIGLVVSRRGRQCQSARGGRRVIQRTPSVRDICARCHQHGARFRYGGIVQADDTDRLCFRCYRAEVARHRTALQRLRRTLASSRSASAGIDHATQAVDGALALDLWGE